MSARSVKALLLAAAVLVAAAADAATLDVSVTSAPQGATVTATWSGITSPTSTDWIALALPGAANTSYISYRYTAGTASGNVPFTILSTVAPGTYQLRLFANNGYTLLATSSNFTVSAPNITLSATPSIVALGGIETAAWSGIPAPTSSDWVGLYAPGAANTAYISWRYTTGAASGSVPFTIPTTVTPGTYQLRLFAAGGYTLLATSGNFTVGLSLGGAVSANGLPLTNVAFTATNGAACGPSNASGQYTCSVPPGWSGSITPQLSGYVFTPSSRSYSNVSVAQTAQNYTAIHNFQVIGTVLFNGAPLANVVFSATNGVNCTSSNASGQYNCIAPQGWSGTVTASLSGYLFTPATRHYSNVAANQSAQDYPAAPNGTYLVSGTVSVNSLPLANVAFTATNGGVCGPSNALGQYSCAVAPGWSGTVTPSASGYSFSPASRSLTSVGTDQSAQDFAATLTSASAPMFFVHVDHLSTPRMIADATGAALWRHDNTEPFGSSVPDENPSGQGTFEFPLRFPGQYADRETSLTYNMERDYAADRGSYVEADPIGVAIYKNTALKILGARGISQPELAVTLYSGQPRYNQLYSYVGNSPTSFVDPRGLDYIHMYPMMNNPPKPDCDCPARMPDFVNFQIDYYVGSMWGTFSRSGNSFLGGGVARTYPSPA